MWHNDPALLFPIVSQTSTTDRNWLVMLLTYIRGRFNQYRYLEVGSYMGGTLTPALFDERCNHILSIDLRPRIQADSRNAYYDYQHASTSAMIETLRVHPELDLSKLSTFDGLASNHQFGSGPYEMAFIDAEHTDEAVFADFLAVYPHLATGGAVAFHDSNLVCSGLENIRAFLRYTGRTTWFAVLRDSSVSAILLDVEAEAVPAIFRENESDWKTFKSKSRDELLLAAVRNRCYFNIALVDAPVLHVNQPS